jgi:hypothetical protein
MTMMLLRDDDNDDNDDNNDNDDNDDNDADVTDDVDWGAAQHDVDSVSTPIIHPLLLLII